MYSKQLIQNKIIEFNNDEIKLYSFLYDLVYDQLIDDIDFLENLYANLLMDQRSEIRRVSIYALLFGLQIQKEKYKNFALENLELIDNNYDLRATCIQAVTKAYSGSKNKQIASTLHFILMNEDDDEDIKVECFVGLLKLIGLSAKEIIQKNSNSIIMEMEDVDLELFTEELKEINEIIS